MKLAMHRAGMALTVVALVVSCGGDSPASANIITDPVARVDVNPTAVSVLVGASSQLSATAFSAAGGALNGRPISWTSSDNSVATVSNTGLVVGVAVGSASITASSEGRSGTANVSVTRAQAASISISPSSATLTVGAQIPLTAAALGTAGDTLPGRTFTWTTSAANVATVSAAGVVTGVAVGTAQISASAEGLTKAITVTVQAGNPNAAVSRVALAPTDLLLTVGTTGNLVPTAFDAANVVLAGKVFTFSSSNNAIATVSNGGVVTGVAQGSAVITVTSEGKTATADVIVQAQGSGAGPVDRVVLSPGQLSLPTRKQDQLTAVAYDAVGRPVPGVSYTFASSNPAVVTVTSTGLLNAVATGTATITATASGKSDRSTITVTAAGGGSVARVDITPASATVSVAGTVQLVGTAYDAQGNPTSAETPLWTTNNPLVAAVTAGGLVTGLVPGSANITMSQGGSLKTVTVTVTGAGLGNIIDVNPGITFQTITGWQAAGQNGWLDCDPTAFAIYKDELTDRLANELGINRLTTALRSGSENVKDYHLDYVARRMTMDQYNDTWFVPINDNSDPFVTDSSKFFWGFLDGNVDNTVIPLRQKLAARGEALYWTLTYVDFTQGNNNKPFLPMKSPDEYAELVTMAFKHLQKRYGFVPNAFELVLEPEHTPYTATDLGRALVAVSNRLKQHGFNPDILGPSTTSVYNANLFYDGMLQVPGTAGLIKEFAYHRYVAVSYGALAAIGLRGQRDGVKTAMLEHIGSGFDDLYEDLTVANVSAWMQFASAFCAKKDDLTADGIYYQINQTNPSAPKINITQDSRLFRQLFMYVRRGAVRLGATSGNATDLLPLAFRNTNGKHVAVIRAKKAATFTVRGLPGGTYGINFSTPTGQWNVSLADQTIAAGGTVQASIPGAGVITVYAR